MNERTVIVDAQLLVLLVVGRTSRDLVAKHKRTRAFDALDFDLLSELIGDRCLLLLPNVVTEASNHLRWHAPPERDHLSRTLKTLVESCEELYISSRVACERREYVRLGLADAALLAAQRGIVLTADAALHLALASTGLPAVNFNHERERYGLA